MNGHSEEASQLASFAGWASRVRGERLLFGHASRASLRESAKAPSPCDEASFSVRKKIICVGPARLFAPARAHVTSQISVGGAAVRITPAPSNFPANSEFTGNFQKLWLSAASEAQIPASAKQGREICTNNQGTEPCRFSSESGHLHCKTSMSALG
jgi:hypothetical protein